MSSSQILPSRESSMLNNERERKKRKEYLNNVPSLAAWTSLVRLTWFGELAAKALEDTP